MQTWARAADIALASQAESDELSNEIGGSVSENEGTSTRAGNEMLWTRRLKQVSKQAGFQAPLGLSKMPPLSVVSSCTGCCAEGAVLKDVRLEGGGGSSQGRTLLTVLIF